MGRLKKEELPDIAREIRKGIIDSVYNAKAWWFIKR